MSFADILASREERVVPFMNHAISEHFAFLCCPPNVEQMHYAVKNAIRRLRSSRLLVELIAYQNKTAYACSLSSLCGADREPYTWRQKTTFIILAFQHAQYPNQIVLELTRLTGDRTVAVEAWSQFRYDILDQHPSMDASGCPVPNEPYGRTLRPMLISTFQTRESIDTHVKENFTMLGNNHAFEGIASLEHCSRHFTNTPDGLIAGDRIDTFLALLPLRCGVVEREQLALSTLANVAKWQTNVCAALLQHTAVMTRITDFVRSCRDHDTVREVCRLMDNVIVMTGKHLLQNPLHPSTPRVAQFCKNIGDVAEYTRIWFHMGCGSVAETIENKELAEECALIEVEIHRIGIALIEKTTLGSKLLYFLRTRGDVMGNEYAKREAETDQDDEADVNKTSSTRDTSQWRPDEYEQEEQDEQMDVEY